MTVSLTYLDVLPMYSAEDDYY